MAEKPLYIELFYRLNIRPGSSVPNSSLTDFVNPQSQGAFSGFSSRFMCDADGKENGNTIVYNGFRTKGSSILLVPDLYYEYVYMTTPENDCIQGFANYIDSGTSEATSTPSQDFAVTGTLGIFDSATLIRIFYFPDLFRKIIITNELYMYSMPKQLQFVPPKKSNFINNEPNEIVLYYTVFLSKEVPISNSTITEIANTTQATQYSTISNRYMTNEDGTQTENIITYLSFRTQEDLALSIPSLYLETLIIITPENDCIQASAVYKDSGFGEITSIPVQDFIVDGALGIFFGAKNVRIIYDNINFTRKVVITNYFPEPYTNSNSNNSISNYIVPSQELVKKELVNINEPNKIVLYYSLILNPIVRISNDTVLDFVLYSQTTGFAGVSNRYMITSDWQQTDTIANFYNTRIPANPNVNVPAINVANLTITSPNGIIKTSSTYKDPGLGFGSLVPVIVGTVIHSTGIYEGAKLVFVFVDFVTTQRRVEILF